ncbi:MAG: peptidylprolyl isomerase [Tidjanibacter sp.]|nr:peptidylprolyl isomerase [Tidjanibacter sp.]
MKSRVISFALAAVALLMTACNKPAKPVNLVMHTSMGDIALVLYDQTPAHRDNFVALVEQNYFDSLLFHRVIEGFMIQGGDPDSRYAEPGQFLGEGGPNYTVEAEIRTPEIFHKRGVLAAAREGNDVNPERRSSASQFYIVWGVVHTPESLARQSERVEMRTGKPLRFTDEQYEAYTTIGGTPHLDGEYTVFGEVVAGLEVVEAIQKVATDANDRPLDDVRILSIERVE